jgi:hypothetical protein
MSWDKTFILNHDDTCFCKICLIYRNPDIMQIVKEIAKDKETMKKLKDLNIDDNPKYQSFLADNCIEVEKPNHRKNSN